jgi:hypothetical protein
MRHGEVPGYQRSGRTGELKLGLGEAKNEPRGNRLEGMLHDLQFWLQELFWIKLVYFHKLPFEN